MVKVNNDSRTKKNIWIIDSGTAGHILNDQNYFIPSSIKRCNANMMGFDGHVTKCTSQGTAIMNLKCGLTLTLKNAYLIPECK